MQGVFAYIGTFGGRKMAGGFSGGYTYGFNGAERIDEVHGDGNALDLGERWHDTRVARLFSIDPLTSQFPGWTPYQFAQNRPIKAKDLLGLQAWDGPNDYNVMSQREYASFVKNMSQKVDAGEVGFKTDCSGFSFYVMAKYFEYKKVTMELRNSSGNVLISSADDKFNNFEQFFYAAKGYFTSAKVASGTNGITVPAEKLETPGDLSAKNGHVFIFIEMMDAQGDGKEDDFLMLYSSGSDFGPNNPASDVREAGNAGVGKGYLKDYVPRRWSFLDKISVNPQVSPVTVETIPAQPISQKNGDVLSVPKPLDKTK